ncbi:MAG: DUF2062 domain-containing protein [Bacteroidales bacterium]|nr:DUF2062 domain-containing protein [Bacteroidales bacterium]
MKLFSWTGIKNFFDKYLLHSNESNLCLALSMSFGVFMGIIPAWGFQMILAAFFAHFLKLNKIIALLFTNVSFYPLIPFLVYFCIYIGSVIMGTEFTLTLEEATIEKAKECVVQYLIGSVVVATIAGLITFVVTYPLLKVFRKDI